MNGVEVWQEFITPEIIIRLHAEGIARYGGLGSPPQEGCIERSAGGAFNAGLYTVGEASAAVEIALPFAGYLLFYLAKNHCFVDGNKRVAWTATMRCLAYYGLTITATQEEAEEFVDQIVRDVINNGADCVEWIARRLTPIEIDEN